MQKACRRDGFPSMITFPRSHHRRRSTVMQHPTTPTPQPPESCKVIIIGAGFAGLAAGTTLCTNIPHPTDELTDPNDHQPQTSFSTEEVVILEASDRVGGRAHTLPLSNTLSVELGCTWLHGIGTREQPNPVLAVATSAGLMSSNPQPQKWWGSTFLLPGRKEELTKDEKILVHKAIEAYAAAIESVETQAEKKEEKLQGGESIHEYTRRGEEEKLKVVGAAVDAAWDTFLQDEQLQHSHTNDSPADGGSHDVGASIELARAAWLWREQLQRAIDGCNSTHDVEATARALYTEFGGSEVHAPVSCGYQTIAEALATGSTFSSSTRAPLTIKFHHEVEVIEWGIDNEDNSTYVLVTCANGARFKASAAIITTSLGVLQQRHENIFIPKLPEKKVRALNTLKIGVVDKIILDFSGSEKTDEEDIHKREKKSYYIDDGGGIPPQFLEPDRGVVTYALLWEDKEEERDSIMSEELPQWAKGIFSIRWGGPEFKRKRERRDGSEANPFDKDSRHFSFEEQEDDEEENDGKDEFPSSLSFPPRYSQAVMWITGDAARSMEATSDNKVMETIKTIFKKFPGIALPLEKNGVDQNSLWENVKLTRSQWGLNPFTAGSYSYVGPTGCPEDVAALAAPITLKSIEANAGDGEKPVLLFAGEACHVEYIGTTHAAYITGKEAGDLLLKTIK